MDTTHTSDDGGAGTANCAERGGREVRRRASRGEALNNRQEAVALLLSTGCTIKGAAAQTGVGERTIKGWLAEVPAFKARVQELRAALFEAAVGKLSALGGRAAEVLGELLDAP